MSEEKKSTPVYMQDENTILIRFDTSREGLEAAVAKTRLDQYGPNHLETTKPTPLPIRYLRQFKDLMIVLLLISGCISFLLGDSRTGIVLFALVLFNTMIGFTQEYKAERIMESLVRLVVPEAKVMRSGKLELITSSEIVLGDIVYIEEGDSVPADLRIVDESELSTNDFALTGESNPSRKFTHAIDSTVPIGDRHNLTFMGTTVATGHGYGVVIGTGMHTELGRIANLSQDTVQDISPLQREMNNIAKHVTQGTVVLCAVLLPVAIQADLGIKSAFLFAIGIASSIIPQGLPAEINTTLAQAAKKLATARALVKKLSAVESLGATSIICTDKTGTLTKNQMTVQQFLIGSQSYSVSGVGYEANGKVLNKDATPLTANELKELEIFFTAGVFASNAHVDPPDNEHGDWYAIGDPTEAALITLARKAGQDPLVLEEKYPELKEFSFDSARKRMSSIRAWGDGKNNYVFVKGAPESVLQKCTHIWDHGHTRPIDQRSIDVTLLENERLAVSALRNLGYAYKVLPANVNLDSITMEEVEKDLTYLGMVSMIDPLREEVPSAMEQAHEAHITVSIITGDYATTARAIALKAGLAENEKDIRIIVGDDVQKLSDTQILDVTQAGSVIFSRVSPEDKLRIVGLIKDSGRVVAVTGDGINDAPALKRADIGVAMGVTGTDVAKQSADIVLLDDSFHTLIGAVQQGRVVFQNIKKGTLSCFTSNSAELVVNLISLTAASLFGVPLALSVMQILAIDLVAELFPIAALGWDKADRELMQEPARSPTHHILNKRAILDLLWCGLVIGGLAYANYILFFNRNGMTADGVATGSTLHMKATALTYLTIVLCQLINILQRRSQDGLFTRYQFHNKQLWFAILLSLISVLLIIYSPINVYFGANPLNLIDWSFALSAALIFLVIREVQRVIVKRNMSEVLLSEGT
jgi:Ca2+-transporting ATPase